jgi:hypothetical protein
MAASAAGSLHLSPFAGTAFLSCHAAAIPNQPSARRSRMGSCRLLQPQLAATGARLRGLAQCDANHRRTLFPPVNFGNFFVHDFRQVKSGGEP